MPDKVSLAYQHHALHWRHIVGAVLDVLVQNKSQEGIAGFKAKGSAWVTVSELRADVWKRTRDHWCQRAHKDFSLFPYSKDYVAYLYNSYRLKTPKAVQRLMKEVKSASAGTKT